MLRGGPVRLVLVLQVTNPNSYALSLSRVTYAGHLGSVRIAEGEHAQEVTLEGGGKATLVRVPVDVLPASLREAFLRTLSKRSLDYALDGSLGVGTPVLGVVQVPFSVSGSMDAVELLRRLGVTLY
jgi:LEA14-like dessication related protein